MGTPTRITRRISARHGTSNLTIAQFNIIVVLKPKGNGDVQVVLLSARLKLTKVLTQETTKNMKDGSP